MRVSIPQGFKVFSPPLFDRTDIWNGNELGSLSVKLLFTTFYRSLVELGYDVCEETSDINLNWGGGGNNIKQKTLFFEHAWAPRFAYQFSNTGVNYNHACTQIPYSDIDALELDRLEKYRMCVLKHYTLRLNKDFHEPKNDFILVPLQSPRNNYFIDRLSVFSKYANDKSENAYWGIAQEIIKSVEALNIDLPVVYVQDPRDTRDYDNVLSTKLKSTFITYKDKVSIHDYFSSDKCKLVVGINTNALNEAIFWNKKVLSFGELIESGSSRIIPSNVDELSSFEDANYWKYLDRLYRNTWFLSDFADPMIVKCIIDTDKYVDRIKTYQNVYGTLGFI
ncbi:hypothetical protein NRZ30_20025 [Aeromonas jandaei]|uniref:hypothetical protein n=1 Tax=Aeromonas jandaei TaxID=650 RepID=UPI00227BCED4|nr:hypothetical protein [Aeromonas jandaei]WAG07290.1 hypothetical protein NRZ30_20025 [Aeromonas jandaei]